MSGKTDNKKTIRPLTPARRRIFKGVALSLPLILFLILELMLRLAGYGKDYRLFVSDPDHPGFLHMNRAVSEKYFMQQDNATIGNQELFKAVKDPGTYRIFILGESSAVGYPYFHNGAFHRWLQFRLMKTFPERNFEVINLGLTAVNSYTIGDFGKQLVDYEPDAVLIYAGHNEYYGALGAGSTSQIGNNPYFVRLLLAARGWRCVQLMTHFYDWLKGSISGKRVDVQDNLMKRMVEDQRIPVGSEKFEIGVKQFRTNIGDLLTVLQAHGIPTLIGTVVSNLKDQLPFISDLTDSAHKDKFFPLYQSGMTALARGDSLAACSFLEAAEKVDSGYAACDYYLGRIAYGRGNGPLARHYFVGAKEKDQLRFRAPEEINRTIRELAAGFPGVQVVAVDSLFAARSPLGIPGGETILEHLHPNLYGYALLSDAFFEKMRTERMIGEDWSRSMSFDSLVRAMPVTKLDSLHGVYEVMMLREGWPFNEPMPAKQQVPRSKEEELAGAYSVRQIKWNQAMEQLFVYYRDAGRLSDALLVSEGLLLEYPLEPILYRRCSDLSMRIGRLADAAWYLKRGFECQPDFELARQLVIVLLKMDMPDKALSFFPYLRDNNTSSVNFVQMEGLVRQVIFVRSQQEQHPRDASYCREVAKAYMQFADADAARIYIRKAMQIAPGDKQTIALSDLIDRMTAEPAAAQ
jgi:tetratricopeptide (TPR) repeat protein